MNVDRVRFCDTISVTNNAGGTNVRPYDPSRSKIILTNKGANAIHLKLQTGNPRNPDGTPNWPVPTIANSGVMLAPNGGSYTEEAYQGPISAIAATAATDLAVTEF